MKKRFISLGMIFAILIGMINISVTAADVETFSENSSFLIKLGVLSADGDLTQSANIRRDRFAKEFTVFINRDSEVDTSQRQEKSYYYDVPLDNEYIAYINFLTENGYVIGDDGDNFRPDDYITNTEMLKCVVAAVGYTINASTAQYPDGYLSVASSLRLTKGLGSLGADATVGDMVQLFYNALDVNVMERSMSEPDKFEINEDLTYLEKVFKIYWVEGRIDANYLTTLDGKEPSVLEDSISIDGNIYSLTEENYYLADYIGYQMRFYFRENNSENEIVAFEDKGTEELVISAENITEFDGSNIYYIQNGSDRETRVRLASDVVIMYNGVTLKSYSPEIFTTIPNGSVELLKLPKASDYSVVKIYSYETYIVKSASEESNKIFTKARRYPIVDTEEENDDGRVEYRYESTTFELDDYDYVFIRNSSGMSISLSNLAENNVISVGESMDGSVAYINVETRAVQGTITRIFVNEDGENAVEIAGAEYVLDRNFEENTDFTIALNMSVTAYLNYKGKIATVTMGAASSGEWAYGYMMNMFTDDLEENYMVKIFTSAGRAEVFTLRDKVNLNGETKKKEDVLKFFKQTPVDGSTTELQVAPQLIRYQLNLGVVSRIDSAVVNISGNESEETSLTMDMPHDSYQFFWNTKQMVSNHNYDFNNYNTAIRVGDNTLIFYVPNPEDVEIGYARARSDDTLYSVKVGSGDFENHQSYNFEVYDIDYNNGALASVIVSRAAADERYLDSIVVKSIENAIDEDDMPCVIINGYDRGSATEVSYTLNSTTTTFEDFYNTSDSGNKPSASIIPERVDIFDSEKGLQKGDIIRVIEEYDKVRSIRRYYSPKFLEEYTYVDGDSTVTVDMIKDHGVIQADGTFMGTDGAATDTAMLGVITGYGNDYITFHNVDPRISRGERPIVNDRKIPRYGKIVLNLSGVSIFKYNSVYDKLEVIDKSELNEYLYSVNIKAYAYVQSNATQLVQLVIYEN